MFKFLFNRSSAATRKKKESVHAASSTPSTAPLTDTFDHLHSIELEDSHYCHLTCNDALTSDQLNSVESKFIQSIRDVIDSERSLEDEIPRLPELLPKLLKMLRSDDASWESVADVINQDSVLVAGVIKVANSSFYRLNVDTADLKQVVAHLGQKGVREVATSVALKPIMQLKGSSTLQNCAKHIWDHALKSAIASRAVADTFQVNPYDAYLAGLVHNVGMIVILKKLSATPGLDDIPCSHLFKEHIIDLSRQLSSKITSCWNMPQSIMDAVNDQLKWDQGQEITKLGEAVFYGKSISIRHTLMNNEKLKDQFGSSFALQNLTIDKPLINHLNKFLPN